MIAGTLLLVHLPCNAPVTASLSDLLFGMLPCYENLYRSLYPPFDYNFAVGAFPTLKGRKLVSVKNQNKTRFALRPPSAEGQRQQPRRN